MNYLSKNIRFLRKQNKLSQQQLADTLGVKRSNIAAYETKNVEPRLKLIYDIAKNFGVTLADLIIVDLGAAESGDNTVGLRSHLPDLRDVEKLREQCERIQRMLDGFKVFYEYKQQLIVNDKSTGGPGGEGDIENFLVFIEHMLRYNQQISDFISPAENPARKSAPTRVAAAGATTDPASSGRGQMKTATG